MTQRELLALGIGLVLIVLGWTMNTGGERVGEGSLEGNGVVGTEEARAREAPLFAGGEDEPNLAPRVEALQPEVGEEDVRVGARSDAPRAGSEPSLEPIAWPAGGLHVRVTTSDGEPAVGAPIGVWVAGGRSPLASRESDTEGRVHFVGLPALAARYEVGLAAPGVQRSGWPVESGGLDTGAEVGLARGTPLQVSLPRCGTLEVHVVRASRVGTVVELGEGTSAGFRVAQSTAAEGDGVARFRWLPLGLELTLRVAFDGGTVEVVVAGPVALPPLTTTPAPSGAATRRVRVGPEGLLEG